MSTRALASITLLHTEIGLQYRKYVSSGLRNVPQPWKIAAIIQSGSELAPEDATQRGDGQEESSRGGDPPGTVGCKTASRNHVVCVCG